MLSWILIMKIFQNHRCYLTRKVWGISVFFSWFLDKIRSLCFTETFSIRTLSLRKLFKYFIDTLLPHTCFRFYTFQELTVVFIRILAQGPISETLLQSSKKRTWPKWGLQQDLPILLHQTNWYYWCLRMTSLLCCQYCPDINRDILPPLVSNPLSSADADKCLKCRNCLYFHQYLS